MKNSVIAVLLIFLLLGLILAKKMSSTEGARIETRDRAPVEALDSSAEIAAPAVAAEATADDVGSPRPNRLPDPASIEAAKAARIAQLEDKVASEPVSTLWAAENAQRIQSFLQADKLRAAHLPAVDYAGVVCRTTICRIELRTQDSLAAGELTQGILQTISEQMPTAQIFENEGAGGTTLLIFSTASATSEGASFRPKR